jgi:hypothetical protein
MMASDAVMRSVSFGPIGVRLDFHRSIAGRIV